MSDTIFDRETMLKALRWLYRNPDAHTAGDLAKDKNGHYVSTMSEEATCFCAIGRYAYEKGIDIKELDSEALGFPPASDEEDDEFAFVWLTNDSAFKFLNCIQTEPFSEESRVQVLVDIGGFYDISREQITE